MKGKFPVIAHQHVELRRRLIRLVSSSSVFGLGRGDDEFHRLGLRHHPGDAVCVHALRVLPTRFFSWSAADIENFAALADHAVDAPGAGAGVSDNP